MGLALGLELSLPGCSRLCNLTLSALYPPSCEWREGHYQCAFAKKPGAQIERITHQRLPQSTVREPWERSNTHTHTHTTQNVEAESSRLGTIKSPETVLLGECEVGSLQRKPHPGSGFPSFCPAIPCITARNSGTVGKTEERGPMRVAGFVCPEEEVAGRTHRACLNKRVSSGHIGMTLKVIKLLSPVTLWT